MKKNLFGKMLTTLAVSVSLVTGLMGCSIGYEDYSAAGTVMGTMITTSFRANGAGHGETVWKLISAEGNRLENDLLSRRMPASEIYYINASAGSEEGILLSEELENYLKLCEEFSASTDGAFDVSIGALSSLWGIDEAAMDADIFVMPQEEDILQACSNSGYEKIAVENHRLYMPEGMLLDLGAVGKGIYLSKSYEILSENAQNGFVAAGGSILTYGYKSNGQPWHIGIADPSGERDVIRTLNLSGAYFISTSGDYERYVVYEGLRYHHILDPSTGYPAISGLSSVTVVIPAEKDWGSFFPDLTDKLNNTDISGFMSDALTTAIFVMGEEEGMLLAEKYAVDVLLVRQDGTIIQSDGMVKYID